MAKIPPSTRTQNNLLESWDKYSVPLNAHSLFKKWGGLSLISAVLTRKVWLYSNPVMPPISPNLFVLFCGAPATGKDVVINTIRFILQTMTKEMEQQQGVNIGPESLSTKGLIDAINHENARLSFTYKNDDGKPTTVHYHSLFIANGEFGTFMPEYNTHMVAIINDLYNCKPTFSELIRGRGNSSEIVVDNPHLSILIGTQPAVFARIVPEEAFQMGFTSRLNICFAKETTRMPFFNDKTIDSTLLPKLISDLRAISLLAGEYKSSKKFKERLNEFSLSDEGHIKSSRFTDYNSRRPLHLAKIAMCCAAAESNELVLTEDHFDKALEYLLLCEKDAPALFDDLVTSNGFAHTVEQVLHGSPQVTITHAELERKLRKTHKPQEVGQIIRSMIQAEDIVFARYNGSMPIYTVKTKEGNLK